MTARLDPALDALAQRICTAAGTDLDTTLRDLRDGNHSDHTPTAMRTGWNLPNLHPTTVTP